MIRDLEFPALEYRTSFRILTTIWNHDNVICSMANYNIYTSSSHKKILDENNLEELELLLEEKFFILPLAGKLARKIYNLIKPIALEIMKWLECQKRISKEETFLKLSIQNICWTSHGTVDNKRTAEALFNSEKLCVSVHYFLACNYCLENCAKILWDKLSTKQKDYYLYKLSCVKNIIVKVMTYYIKNKIDQLRTPRSDISAFEQALFYAVESGNKAATIFFVGKLSAEIKNNTIDKYLMRLSYKCQEILKYGNLCWATGYYSEIVLILVRNANTETLEQLTSLRGCDNLLNVFLQFPAQQLFHEFTQCIQNLISDKLFYRTLEYIIFKIDSCDRYYNYAVLLKDFLKLKPEFPVVLRLEPFRFLYHFFSIQDEEGVSLILKGSSLEMKQKIISHFKGKELCEILVSRKDWNFLRFFISTCIEDEHLEKFQDLFQQVPVCVKSNTWLFPLRNYGERTDNYLKLYRFVGSIIQRKGIKRCTDDSLSIAKRTRSQGFTPIKIKLQEEDVEWPRLNNDSNL